MFDTITRAISTALFFLCTAVVTGLTPPPSAETVPAAAAVSEAEVEYSLVGMWNSGGKTFEFTPSGKLICGDITLDYTQSGNTVTVTGTVSGEKREYTLELAPISKRVARLNGIKMYRIK